YAIAKLLAKSGCNAYMAARDAQVLQQAAQSIPRESPAEVKYCVADLSVPGAAQRLLSEVGPIDILVNNAGAIPSGFLGDLPEELFREALETKLFSYTHVAEDAFKGMKEQGGGTILSVIGSAGERPRANYAIGSMANAALAA